MHSSGHKKHTALERPSYGHFSRNEWAFLGAPCGLIKELAGRIIAALPQYRLGYVDAQHTKDGEEVVLPGRLQQGATVEYSQQVGYHQLQFTGGLNDYKQRMQFNSCDAVLVNGNHFEAATQVVILDESKKESLRKRLSQLHSVQLIIRTRNDNEPYDFLSGIIPEHLPIYSIEDTESIAAFFAGRLKNSVPAIQGLVLAGGQSLRLGRDKGLIDWHGRDQRSYLADLLHELTTRVHISCRVGQQIESPHHKITDSFTGLGPYGALLSAFREAPDAAFLVVACDMPFLDRDALQYLLEHRNPSADATAFKSPRDGSPEPLAAIWEPCSYPLLLNFLAQGISCPRKALLNSTVEILESPQPEWLMNVNTPDDEAEARSRMEQSEK